MSSSPVQPTYHSGIIYDVLQDQDLGHAIECVTNTFAVGDPLSRAVGLSIQDLESYIQVFMQRKLVTDGLSVVARDDSNGNVVGAILMGDFMTRKPEDMEGLSRKMLPYIAILDNLDRRYIANNDIQRGEVLHVFMAGVSDLQVNKGIGFQMLLKGYEIARSKGYRRAISEITGAASQHVAEKYGARTLYKVLYRDFEYQGVRPFRTISECESCKLMYVDI